MWQGEKDMRKLIVNRRQAKTIRDHEEFTLERKVTKRGVSNLQEAVNRSYPKGAKFWVAEPLCCIRTEFPGANEKHFSADKTPNGWIRYTLDRPGTRVHFGEHRFLIEVVELCVVVPRLLGDDFADVSIKFKKVVE